MDYARAATKKGLPEAALVGIKGNSRATCAVPLLLSRARRSRAVALAQQKSPAHGTGLLVGRWCGWSGLSPTHVAAARF